MIDHMIGAVRQAARRFYAQYDPAATAAYVRANCRSEAEHLLHQAEDLMQNTFVFTDRWDMEPCAVPYTVPAGQWTHSPNGDPEWVFMLNRHDYLPKLWQAAVLTGEVRYRRKLIDSVMDWIASNPLTREGTPSTRTIDTGIRCMNWIQLLPFLLAEDALTDQEARTMIDSLSAQFANLRERYIPKYTLSNWGVLQTTAFCAGYAWMGQLLPSGFGSMGLAGAADPAAAPDPGGRRSLGAVAYVPCGSAECPCPAVDSVVCGPKAGLSLCQGGTFCPGCRYIVSGAKGWSWEGTGSEAGWLVRPCGC